MGGVCTDGDGGEEKYDDEEVFPVTFVGGRQECQNLREGIKAGKELGSK